MESAQQQLSHELDAGVVEIRATVASTSQHMEEKLVNVHGNLLRELESIRTQAASIPGHLKDGEQASAFQYQGTRRSIATSSARTVKAIGAVKKEVVQSRRVHQNRSKRLLQSNSELHAKIDLLVDHVASTTLETTPRAHSKYEGLNLQDITLPLMLLKPTLFEKMSHLISEGEIDISSDEAMWLQSEFEDLLASSHEAAATSARKKSQGAPVTVFANDQPAHSSCATITTTKRKLDVHGSVHERSAQQRAHLRNRRSWLQRTAAGLFAIQFGDPSDEGTEGFEGMSDKFGISISFLPHSYNESQMGISATYARLQSLERETRILRHISTYALIPINSPAFKCLIESDVPGLQRLFSLGQASPTDHTAFGPLLHVSLQLLNICRLPLNGLGCCGSCKYRDVPVPSAARSGSN